MALAVAWIAPYGEYPLADDWQYARVVRRFAEAGSFQVDVDIAPSLVGQAVLSYPFVATLGFSHVLLRALTLGMGLLLLLVVDRLLSLGGTSRALRRASLVCLGVNPLYLYLCLTYQTEIWSLALAFAGALIWFEGRRRELARDPATWLPSTPTMLAAAALMGASFWIRQFAIVVLPCVVGSSCLSATGRGRGSAPRGWPRLLPAVALGLLSVLGYLAWAEATGNLKPQFSGPLAGMLRFPGFFWTAHPAIFAIYMTAFLGGLLVLIPLEASSWKRLRTWVPLVVLAGVLAMGLAEVEARAQPDAPSRTPKAVFPYLNNVLAKAGVGPVTLTDVYFTGAPMRDWEPLSATWAWIERGLLVLSLLWAAWIHGASRLWHRGAPQQRELVVFGLLVAGGSLVTAGHAYDARVFDRYYAQSLLGLCVAVPVVVSFLWQSRPPGIPRSRWLVWGSLVAALSFYGVAGLHDYFRWNDARWGHFTSLRQRGVSALNIAGGFEIEGWGGAYDRHRAGEFGGARCHGDCGCMWRGRWWCYDDSFRISMNRLPGYRVEARSDPDYWLLELPPVYLLERDPIDRRAPRYGPKDERRRVFRGSIVDERLRSTTPRR